jgi:hypothetical protein
MDESARWRCTPHLSAMGQGSRSGSCDVDCAVQNVIVAISCAVVLGCKVIFVFPSVATYSDMVLVIEQGHIFIIFITEKRLLITWQFHCRLLHGAPSGMRNSRRRGARALVVPCHLRVYVHLCRVLVAREYAHQGSPKGNVG